MKKVLAIVLALGVSFSASAGLFEPDGRSASPMAHVTCWNPAGVTVFSDNVRKVAFGETTIGIRTLENTRLVFQNTACKVEYFE